MLRSGRARARAILWENNFDKQAVTFPRRIVRGSFSARDYALEAGIVRL